MAIKKTVFHFLFFASIVMNAQRKIFTLSDTSFAIGDNFTTRDIIFNKKEFIYLSQSHFIIDSVFQFMQKNKTIVLEVGVHISYPESQSCYTISAARAKNIIDTLVKKGISAERLDAKGYGATRALIPETIIERAKTPEEKAALMNRNKRIVFTIIRPKNK